MSMFFLHSNGIREYKENGDVVELCEPMPQIPEEAFEYARNLLKISEFICGAHPIEAHRRIPPT